MKTRVLAHELGYAPLHDGTAAYYSAASHGVEKSEQEADRFAVQLLTQLFLEHYDHLLETIGDLRAVYRV